MTLMREAMLPPLRTPPSLFFLSLRPPDAPAMSPPPSVMPSTRAAIVSSSTGRSCSARSYLREMGRKISAAAWCAWLAVARSFFGSSRLIMSMLLRVVAD